MSDYQSPSYYRPRHGDRYLPYGTDRGGGGGGGPAGSGGGGAPTSPQGGQSGGTLGSDNSPGFRSAEGPAGTTDGTVPRSGHRADQVGYSGHRADQTGPAGTGFRDLEGGRDFGNPFGVSSGGGGQGPIPDPVAAPPVHQQRESSGDHAPQGNQVSYDSFGDFFNAVRTPGAQRGQSNIADPSGGGSFFGNFAENLNPFNRSAGENIGGVLGSALIPIPIVGGLIGSTIGGQFQDAIVPEEEAAPPSPALSPEQAQARSEAVVANQESQREREEDTHRTDAYAGTTRASGSSASSGGRGGRRGSSEPDHGNRQGSGTGGQAQSGEYVSNSHDWSAARDDSDSGGGGGGGGGGK